MDPKSLRYAKSHEWAAVEGDTVRVGITQFAVDLLTDLTHVELPTLHDVDEPADLVHVPAEWLAAIAASVAASSKAAT